MSTKARRWRWVLAAWVVGCAGVQRPEREEEAAGWAASAEEACEDERVLRLECREGNCAFYRCRDIQRQAPEAGLPPPGRNSRDPLYYPPAAPRPPLVRGAGPPARWWNPVGEPWPKPGPVFEIPWGPKEERPEEKRRREQAEEWSRRARVKQWLFPQDEEGKRWVRAKGIDPEGMVLAIPVEDYVRIHAGKGEGMWMETWRELRGRKPQATAKEVWTYAMWLADGFRLLRPVEGLKPVVPAMVLEQDVRVRAEKLGEEEKMKAEEVLVKCAEQAQREVLRQKMKGRKPTARECMEEGRWEKGGPVETRAVMLGREMHRKALQCAEEGLRKVKPMGFAIEQRYRYDTKSDTALPVSKDVAEWLLRQGLGEELRGTLVPDVVLHAEDVSRVQGTYDYKFPCVDPMEVPRWRPYEADHPFSGYSQGAMYKRAFDTDPRRILPGLGVIP